MNGSYMQSNLFSQVEDDEHQNTILIHLTILAHR